MPPSADVLMDGRDRLDTRSVVTKLEDGMDTATSDIDTAADTAGSAGTELVTIAASEDAATAVTADDKMSEGSLITLDTAETADISAAEIVVFTDGTEVVEATAIALSIVLLAAVLLTADPSAAVLLPSSVSMMGMLFITSFSWSGRTDSLAETVGAISSLTGATSVFDFSGSMLTALFSLSVTCSLIRAAALSVSMAVLLLTSS